MTRTLAIVAFALLAQCHLIAADIVAPVPVPAPVPADHSTVHIVFIAPVESYSPVTGRVGQNGKPVPMARAGNAIVPFDTLSPVSITINAKFSGHAMFGYSTVSPVFVLPSGNHKFDFQCDGYKPVTQSLHVLGTGSTQYLVVKLHPSVNETASPVRATTRTN
ncbi:MAG: hypothetical protein WBD31_20570 [Rubripirellula sp.]